MSANPAETLAGGLFLLTTLCGSRSFIGSAKAEVTLTRPTSACTTTFGIFMMNWAFSKAVVSRANISSARNAIVLLFCCLRANDIHGSRFDISATYCDCVSSGGPLETGASARPDNGTRHREGGKRPEHQS